MEDVILTEQILEKGKSRNGAWSATQVALFGVLEFKKGWKKQILGKSFPEEKIKQFIALKDHHLK